MAGALAASVLWLIGVAAVLGQGAAPANAQQQVEASAQALVAEPSAVPAEPGLDDWARLQSKLRRAEQQARLRERMVDDQRRLEQLEAEARRR